MTIQLSIKNTRRKFVKAGSGVAITSFGAGLPFSGANAQSRYAKYAGKSSSPKKLVSKLKLISWRLVA
jgi:hypothetical protein